MSTSSQIEFDHETLKLTRQVFETSSDHISIVGPDYRYRRVNPAYEHAHGITQEKIINLHVADLLGDETFQDVVKPRLDQSLGGEEVEYESWITFKQSDRRYMSIRYTPLKSQDQTVEGVVVQARDMTKYMEAKTARATLELSVDHALEGLALHDEEGIFTYINPAQAEMYGYKVEELLGKSWKELYDTDQRLQIEQNHFPVLMKEGKWNGHLTGRKKTGESFDVEVSLTLLKDSQKNPAEFICTCRDITERMKLEKTLRENEFQFRDLYESAPVAYFSATLDGQITKVNTKAEELLGYSKQELIGKSVLSLYASTENGRAKAALLHEHAQAGTGFLEEELEMQKADGTNVWISLTVQFGYDQEGNIIERRGIVRDITERKRAEEELIKAHQQLAEQKEHLARLNDSFVQALGEITYDYNHLTDHIQWGGAYRRILGYTPEGMGNNIESWLSRIYPHDAQAAVQEFEQAIASKIFFELEYRFKRRDGSYAWMHDRGVIHRNEAGQVEKVTGIMRDITDRKKEEEFRERQNSILELITRGMSLPTILKEICIACESQCDGILSSILLLDGDRLRHGAGPSLPDSYNQAVDGILIGPTAGSCGTAVYRKDLVIVRDIENDPLWEQGKRLALRHNLRACWSMPILSSSESILGTFAMYYRDPHHPTEQELEVLQVFNHLARIAIERKNAEEELQRAHDDLEERVQVRTMELSQANALLMEYMADRQRAEKQFVNIVKGVSGTTGERFFPSFVEQLTVALEVDYAFVGQLIEKNEPTVSTIAVYGDGRFLDNFEYGLNHTPCKNVATRQKFCSFPKEVKQLFPQDRLLDDLGIDGYAGVPLKDSDDQVIGLMVVLKKEPLTKLHMVESTMKIFAARAAAELERKRSEEALTKSETLAREQLAELNMIYNSAPIGLCLVDKDLRYVRINETLSQMNGVPATDHIGKRFKDVLPDVGHHSNSIAKSIFQTAQPALGVEFQGITPAHPGQQRHWLANYYPIIDEGEVKAIGGVVQDITERKQREALLHTIHQAESEFIASEDPSKIFDRLLRSILTISNSEYGFIGEALRTDDGKLYLKTHAITNIAWNQETRELYERSAPNLEFYNLNTLSGEVLRTGQPVIANDPQNDPRKCGLPNGHPPMHAFLGLPFFQGDRLVGMVGVANRPEGYDEQLIAFLQPLLTSCGTLLNAYQIEQRRRQTEQALQESEARLQAILDNSPGLVFLKDLKGRYLHVNRKFEQVFHQTRERVIGKTDHEIFPSEQASQFQSNDQQVIQTGTASEFEEKAIHDDGLHFSIVCKFPVLNEKGEPFAIGGITVDITERKRAEEEITSSKQAYQDLVNSLDGIVWECDFPSYQFTLVSKPAERLLGYPIDRWLTDLSFFPNHIHEDDREWALNYCQLSTLEKRDHELEYRMIHANGQIIWFRDLVTVVVEDGQPVKLRGVMVDITQRKSAEHALREAQSFTTSIIENIPNMVFVKDAKDLRFVRLNKAGESLLGYHREELLGKNDYDFFPKEEADFFTNKDRTVLQNGKLLNIPEEPIHTRENGIRLLHTKKIPVYDEQGHAQYLLGISEDITERKQAEEALKQSEERFRALASHAPVGIFLSDNQGDCQFVNEFLCKMLGLSLPEAQGSGWVRSLHTDDRERVVEEWKNATNRRGFFSEEYRFQRPDGGVSWVAGTAVPRESEEGQVLEYLGVCADITPLKHLENEIRKYAEGLEQEVLQRTARIRELEQRRMQVEKLAALAQVAAGVAHEINNPLASIAQSMALFKRAISPRHHRYQYIGKVEECIERIARIVKQLYQLNRPEPPIFMSNDIIDTVRNSVEIMKGLAAKRGIKVISRLPAAPIAAKISQSDVIQVLCNLIQNALDVSQPEDRISISVVPRSDTIAIRVRDHGPGISPEIAPHIFEPFFTTKSEANAGGMGLGLAISHNLIEAMGGALDFKTSIGQGTTFTIKLPKT